LVVANFLGATLYAVAARYLISWRRHNSDDTRSSRCLCKKWPSVQITL